MKKAQIFEYLHRLLQRSPSRTITDDDRVVVFSDLHIGNGGGSDDFRGNAELFLSVLSRHYAARDYTLVLNGDIEELQKFPRWTIRRAWPELFECFEGLRKRDRLIRLWGNHDEILSFKPDPAAGPVHEGFRLLYKGWTLFIFHGHQASSAFQRYNKYLGLFIRYLMRPLGIMNDSVAHSSRRKYKIEKRVYKFSGSEKILSVIGHTHRPLFESLSKVDSLRFRIEELCRRHPEAAGEERAAIAQEIGGIKTELRRLLEKDQKEIYPSSLYQHYFTIPCIFNSGCVIGKRGMTCLEIAEGRLRLVHWFDAKVADRFEEAEPMEGTDIRRLVIKEDSLDYIFTRIDLLT